METEVRSTRHRASSSWRGHKMKNHPLWTSLLVVIYVLVCVYLVLGLFSPDLLPLFPLGVHGT